MALALVLIVISRPMMKNIRDKFKCGFVAAIQAEVIAAEIQASQ